MATCRSSRPAVWNAGLPFISTSSHTLLQADRINPISNSRPAHSLHHAAEAPIVCGRVRLVSPKEGEKRRVRSTLRRTSCRDGQYSPRRAVRRPSCAFRHQGSRQRERRQGRRGRLLDAVRLASPDRITETRTKHPLPRRNKDLRLTDNRAFARASAIASSLSLPIVILHIFSPSDYTSHDRSPRRIDFQIRTLRLLRDVAAERLAIPLYTVTWDDRRAIVDKLRELLKGWNAVALVGNLEYEVDELRRDAEVLRKVAAARKEGGEGWKGDVEFWQDFCLVNPGTVTTQVSFFFLEDVAADLGRRGDVELTAVSL